MKAYWWVMGIAVATLVLFWLPWIGKVDQFWGIKFGGHGMETIVQNFDGLNYLAVAKSMYNTQILTEDFAMLTNSPIYYAAHFPLFPLLIKSLDLFLTGPQAMLVAIILTNILLGGALYYFFMTFTADKKLAMIFAIGSLFFPARMLSVRAVGSTEPLFIALVLLSLTWAHRGTFWLSALSGALAILTRSTAIWLLPVYVLVYRKNLRQLFPYAMIPLSLFLLFSFYTAQLGDFWAYFRNSRELHPVLFPPFSIFSNMQHWVTSMWREEFIYQYVFYGVGIALLAKKFIALRFYGLIYGMFVLLIAHQDLARYFLPLAPLALLGYSQYFPQKFLKWGLLLLIPIYLLGWQFVVANVQAISDWRSFL